MKALALASLTLLLLAGCTGNGVTVAGQGYTSGTQTKSLTCGVSGAEATGTLSYGEQGAGSLHVKVTDGKGATIHESGGGGSAGQAGQSVPLRGAAGTWTLSVDTGIGYAGQWAITLTC